VANVTLEPRGTPTDAQDVEEGDLLIPGSGGWSATVRLHDPQERAWAVGDLVTLRWLDQACLGAIDSTATMEGKLTLFVVGGQGKLGAEVPPKHYQSASPALVLRELCGAAGELGPDLARLPPVASLFQFPRRRASAAAVLDDLARALGCPWAVGLDGRVELGAPSWSAVPDFDHDELDEDSVYQTVELTLRDAFGPVPGQTFDGRRVGCVRHTVTEHGARVRIWFTSDLADVDSDPLRSAFVDLIRQTVPLVWLGKYPGSVRAVRADGTWDVDLDEKRLPPIVGARPRVFAPGARIVPPLGSRVELSFEQADPRYPVAELFEAGSAQRGIVRLNDTVGISAAFGVWLGTIVTAINGLVPGSVSPTIPSTIGTSTSASDRAFLP